VESIASIPGMWNSMPDTEMPKNKGFFLEIGILVEKLLFFVISGTGLNFNVLGIGAINSSHKITLKN
jgi:hypothetical protein